MMLLSCVLFLETVQQLLLKMLIKWQILLNVLKIVKIIQDVGMTLIAKLNTEISTDVITNVMNSLKFVI